MDEQHIDALIRHRLLDARHAPVEFFGRESLAVSSHLLSLWM
jgi:hypothetical protein